MELLELENIWKQYDSRLSETTRLNKEILKRLLQLKPEKRLNWLKIKAGFNLLLPIFAVVFVLLPGIEFRNEIDFYIGILLFGLVYILFYTWAIKYFLLVNRIDFIYPITLIRKNFKQLEKTKIKITKLGYILMPIALIGIFLMADFPILSKNSILPLSLIVLVFSGSIYYTFKVQIFKQFRKIDRELNEIEKLEE
jgi:hypothetical protein